MRVRAHGLEPTPSRVGARLRNLLRELHDEPPYILVGHSWGGALVRFFAGRYPEEVAGILYIDPTDVTQAAVVTEALVSQLFDGPALGRFLRVRSREDGATPYQVEIVGVVPSPSDPMYYVYTQRGGDVPAVFLPSPIGEQLSRGLYVRTRGPANALVPEIRKVVGDIDPRPHP